MDERERLAERFTRLARVASELVLADSEAEVSNICIEHLADAAGATVASMSLLVDEGTLRLVGARGTRAGMMDSWATYPVDARTPAGEAVLQDRMVVVQGEAELGERYPALDSGVSGDRAIVCLPLRIGTRRLGVLTMSYPGRRDISAAELEFLAVMSDTCAQALVRVQMTAEAADRQDKIRFLADASVELSRSLDYEVTLAKVARLAVPWFADYCAISLEQDGELRTLAVEHVDPAKVEVALEVQRRFSSGPDGETGSYRVFRSGRSVLVPEVDDAAVAAAIADPERLRLVRALDIRSMMTVPLRVHDRVLGVVTWVAGAGGRRFDVDDLAFGEDLALRAAIAIDTAGLHSKLHEVAARLQRAVMPGDLPQVPGWRTAACYLQADHSEAGGDFYDVTELGDGRIAVFVGDVMGRGVTAAAAMAQTRAAIRALVLVDPDPSAVLTALDRLFEHYGFHQLVTLVYAVVDPGRDEVVVVNAGHPPPVVRRADGTVELLSGRPGLLLGAGGAERPTTRVPLLPGDAFLGFTDGLVERRDEDIDVGLERLAAACRRAPDQHAAPSGVELSRWLHQLVADVRDPARDDDVAAVVLLRA